MTGFVVTGAEDEGEAEEEEEEVSVCGLDGFSGVGVVSEEEDEECSGVLGAEVFEGVSEVVRGGLEGEALFNVWTRARSFFASALYSWMILLRFSR